MIKLIVEFIKNFFMVKRRSNPFADDETYIWFDEG